MPSTEQKLHVLVRHSTTEKDVALAGELLQHLDPLKRFAGVDVWSEARIRPGDDWREEIRRAIDEADVALVLLSSDFLATDGLMDVEVPRLLERRRAGALRVIPILLRSCLWEVHPWLRELKPLPKGGKAIGAVSSDARDEVLTEVAKEIVSLASGSLDDARPTRLPAGAASQTLAEGQRDTKQKQAVDVSIARRPTQRGRMKRVTRAVRNWKSTYWRASLRPWSSISCTHWRGCRIWSPTAFKTRKMG